MIKIQVKQFKDCKESEVNKFLQSINPKSIIDIKYTSINEKGWDRDGLDHDEPSYETSKNVTNVLIVYWKAISNKNVVELK